MEKVQFQLEATLPELKDLHEKGLFTKHEIDQITRRRTAFETSLIRRQTRKDDFFKYAEYEINLEQLRKVRWRRMGYHINPPPPSASTYSLPRRTVYILKRATMKFPGDIAVWLAYVEFASRQGMRKVVLKGLTTALQHHPLSPTIYLLLSYHHLHPTSPFPRDIIPSTSNLDLPSTNTQDTGFSLEGTAAARTQLLLGIRLLPRSTQLWTEYIKLELGWVEALRRRWNVLGIADTIDAPVSSGVSAEMTGGEGSFGPEGEDARKSILSGQLVVHALESALEAIQEEDGLQFRLELLQMFRRYPSALRAKCLDAVYADLETIAKGNDDSAAKAKLAVTTRGLYDMVYVPGQADAPLEGVELVEEVGKIGKEIRKKAKDGAEFLQVAAEWLSSQVEEQKENDDLRSYLLSIMTTLTSSKYSPPASLLVRHLELVKKYDPSRDLSKLARSHAAEHPSSAPLQLARLECETEQRTSDLGDVFERAVKAVSHVDANEENDVRKIWFTWTAYTEEESADSELDLTWTKILTLSSKLNQPTTHTALLGRYFVSTLQRSSPLPALRTIDSFAKYRPTEEIFAIALVAIAVYTKEPYHDLTKLYERWKSAARTKDGRVEAALAWAGWLLENKKAHLAAQIVDSVRREDEADVERRWKEMCDEAEERGAEAEGSEVEQLERKLRVIGWGGLATPEGISRPVEIEESESEDEDEDEEMEEGEGDSDEDSDSGSMDINM